MEKVPSLQPKFWGLGSARDLSGSGICKNKAYISCSNPWNEHMASTQEWQSTMDGLLKHSTQKTFLTPWNDLSTILVVILRLELNPLPTCLTTPGSMLSGVMSSMSKSGILSACNNLQTLDLDLQKPSGSKSEVQNDNLVEVNALRLI